jgi:hypothetical protein
MRLRWRDAITEYQHRLRWLLQVTTVAAAGIDRIGQTRAPGHQVVGHDRVRRRAMTLYSLTCDAMSA